VLRQQLKVKLGYREMGFNGLLSEVCGEQCKGAATAYTALALGVAVNTVAGRIMRRGVQAYICGVFCV
jgi:hypothetical protein